MSSTQRHPTRRRSRVERPPTVETVAARAGVSRQTVSNVLNAPQRVLPATRERVMSVIDELGYRPNRLGSALQSRITRTFGYRCHLSEDEENLLLDRFLHDLCRAGAARRHHIVLVSPVDVDEELAAYEEMYRTGGVDGFVLSGTHPGDRRLEPLIRLGIPFVTFGRDWDRPEQENWVDIDGASGTNEAVRHFWAAGHRRIAWIGETGGGSASDRQQGYRVALADLGGLPVEIECRDQIEAVSAEVDVALQWAQRPTAFVCASDTAAVGCARAAAAAGLRVGTDVGIVGFDDSRLALATSPPLSSIRQPTERVAELLIDGLIDLVAGKTMASTLLAPTLIHRGSS